MPADLPILIAAAGIGSRLGMNLPKCLVEVHGRSLLERLLVDVLADEPDVRIIVGFRADEVIAKARSVRKDLMFVRNPSFRDTSVRHSFWLAARHVQEPCIIVDGDMLIAPESWRAFRREADRHTTLVGVAAATTTDAVFADVDVLTQQLRRFTRRDRLGYEWCGVAKMSPQLFDRHTEYVYQCIEPILPAPAFELDTAEVDTQQDLRLAVAFAQRIDTQRLRAALPASAAASMPGRQGVPAARQKADLLR
jgi:choline kinase